MHSIKNPGSKLLRWRLRLSEYDYDVLYKKGTANSNADALSRNPCDLEETQFDLNLNLQPNNDNDPLDPSFKHFRKVLILQDLPPALCSPTSTTNDIDILIEDAFLGKENYYSDAEIVHNNYRVCTSYINKNQTENRDDQYGTVSEGESDPNEWCYTFIEKASAGASLDSTNSAVGHRIPDETGCDYLSDSEVSLGSKSVCLGHAFSEKAIDKNIVHLSESEVSLGSKLVYLGHAFSEKGDGQKCVDFSRKNFNEGEPSLSEVPLAGLTDILTTNDLNPSDLFSDIHCYPVNENEPFFY